MLHTSADKITVHQQPGIRIIYRYMLDLRSGSQVNLAKDSMLNIQVLLNIFQFQAIIIDSKPLLAIIFHSSFHRSGFFVGSVKSQVYF